ncbi:hypothetical protein FGO68_gene6697 [Halteria grandinella]|uniref:Uncharacterized protein n=1 Tax=Halteria grandinella TaxID=5974 RepID=A0A8J8P608_HALGN|nr:hypothetical protein FGO68_gene6697 [Halteria grandinella]
MEIITRISYTKYKETGIAPNITEALKLLIEMNIMKNYEPEAFEDGEQFRRKHLYSCEVNDVMLNGDQVTRKCFSYYCHPNKKWVTLKECQELIQREAQIRVSELSITQCFAQSIMPIIDPVLQAENLLRMKYVEFLEFLARVAFEFDKATYKGAIENQSDLDGASSINKQDGENNSHLKIEKLIIQLAFAVNIPTYQPLYKKGGGQGAYQSSMMSRLGDESEILNKDL